jgi:hypothetical protein
MRSPSGYRRAYLIETADSILQGKPRAGLWAAREAIPAAWWIVFPGIRRKMPLRHGGSLRAPVLDAPGSADWLRKERAVSVGLDRQG